MTLLPAASDRHRVPDPWRAEADLRRAGERFAAASTCPRTSGETVARLREALERARARLAEAMERQEALPEEARRAGVPSW